MEFPLYLHVLLLTCIYLLARLLPLWPSRDRGSDAYYFLLCAEAFRHRKRLPIVLPGLYILESDEQTYPPMFSVLIGLIPEILVKKYHWTLNHILDLPVIIALFLLAYYLVGPATAWGVSLVYAFEANLLSEYQALTSRPLSTLLLFLFLGSVYLGISQLPWYFAGSVVFGAILIFTHKLAMQLLWFLAPFLSILRGEPEWVLAMLGAYGLAAIAGRGYFIKLQQAHWDIVTFWHRNWRWLGAHQVRQSPVYGNEEQAGFHEGPPLQLFISQSKRMLLANPWVIPVVAGAAFMEGFSELEGLLLLTTAGIYCWALATVYIPPMRCLGEGTKYIKYAEPITLVLTASFLVTRDIPWLWGICGLLAIWQLFHFYKIARNLGTPGETVSVMSSELEAVMDHLKEDDGARVMCISTHLADLVAYHARKPVLWGTHGFGFRQVEPFFPLLRKRIEEFVSDYNLTYLLLNEQYVEASELVLDSVAQPVIRGRSYSLYKFDKRAVQG